MYCRDRKEEDIALVLNLLQEEGKRRTYGQIFILFFFVYTVDNTC
jgi:hypothetical protein